MREADAELERLSARFRAIAHALNLELLHEGLRDALNHVGDQRARHPVQRPAIAVVVRPREQDLGVLDPHADVVRNPLAEIALRALHADLVGDQIHRDAARDRDRSPADARHAYQTSHTTSPPTAAARALSSDKIPFEVEITEMPSPLRTFGSALAPA